MRKLVVATNVGGIPEIVFNVETGFLVIHGDHHEMADRICELLTNSALRKKWEIWGIGGLKSNFLSKFINKYWPGQTGNKRESCES